MTTAKSIHPGQWIAENKVIRPHFPEDNFAKAIISASIAINKHNCSFSEFAKQHTYATDLPDGTYNADDLGEVIWQEFYEGQWERITSDTMGLNVTPTTRQFLTLKRHPMKEEGNESSYSEVEKALALRAVVELFGDEITKDTDATALLMELYLKGYYAVKF